ncbi:MAG: WD40 repeat domain-containing protein [Akkermansiaceae bacterium]
MRLLALVWLAGCALVAGREPDFFLQHGGEWVTAMTGDPAGKMLVSGSNKGIVRVWTLEKEPYQSRELVRFPDPVTALCFEPGLKTILAGTWSGKLVALDTKEGKLMRQYEEHRETITALGFSPDSKYFASGSADDRLVVWDLKESQSLFEMHQGNEYDVTTLAFSPDGETIATGDGENQIKLWDASLGEAIKTLKGHREPVSQLLYDQKGRLVSAGWDKEIRIWEGEKSRVLKGHTSEITALEIAGDKLFSASEDGTIRIWDLATRKEVVVLKAGMNLRCLKVLGEGRLVLAGTREKVLGWRME